MTCKADCQWVYEDGGHFHPPEEETHSIKIGMTAKEVTALGWPFNKLPPDAKLIRVTTLADKTVVTTWECTQVVLPEEFPL